MRVLLVIENENGAYNVTPFPIINEEKVDQVVDQAESLFLQKCIEAGYDTKSYYYSVEDLIENGIFNNERALGTYTSVCLHWIDLDLDLQQ